jgi:transcriptional regulator with XRE-family HTH domain
LGSLLRTLRLQRGLTQGQAAGLMGIHTKSLARIEAGSENLTVSTLLAASVAYKVRLRDLFDDEEA